MNVLMFANDFAINVFSSSLNMVFASCYIIILILKQKQDYEEKNN